MIYYRKMSTARQVYYMIVNVVICTLMIWSLAVNEDVGPKRIAVFVMWLFSAIWVLGAVACVMASESQGHHITLPKSGWLRQYVHGLSWMLIVVVLVMEGLYMTAIIGLIGGVCREVIVKAVNQDGRPEPIEGYDR
jgi:hypothetical protein